MRNLSTGAVLLTCGLVVGCGSQQPENSQNLEPNGAAVAAENARVAEVGTGHEPHRSAPPASPRADDSAVAGTSRRFSPAPDEDRASAPRAEAGAPAPPAPRWRDVTVPAGTALPLELLTAISSETAQ